MADTAFNATITRREDPTPDLTVLQITPDGWELPAFEPGQYTTLGLPDPDAPDGKLLKRVFSIASAPGAGHVEFYLRLVPGGKFTTLVWPLAVGAPIWMGDRFLGKFTLQDVSPDKDLLLVSTGTGLAPFLSMLRHYRGKKRWRRVAILHGARLAGELGYADELTSAAEADDSVTYVGTVTREPDDSGWTGRRGRVTALLDDPEVGPLFDPDASHVFLCGNPEMIDEMEKLLEPRGFRAPTKERPGNLHFERYW